MGPNADKLTATKLGPKTHRLYERFEAKLSGTVLVLESFRNERKNYAQLINHNLISSH